MYAILKHSHLLILALSFLTFFVRGIFMMRDSKTANHKIFKIVPHIFYTLLIVTGIGLAIQLHYSPMQHPWLIAKIIALGVYIVLGVLTFKHANAVTRKILWALTLTVFIYIISVAQSKNPLGFFIYLQ